MPENLRNLENKIGYYFTNRAYLKEAMTHGSVRANNPELPHHERLEFLGDAVLYTVISEYYFKKNSIADPGKLTALRQDMIMGSKQNQIASNLEIWRYVDRGPSIPDFRVMVDRWGEFIEALIGAVYVDAGMGDQQGLQKAKEVIYKLWELEDEPAAGLCSIM